MTRIQRLERRTKLLAAGLALSLLPWAAAAVPAAKEYIVGKTVIANEAIMIGSSPQSVRLGIDEKGISFRDDKGKQRMFIGVLKPSGGSPTPVLLFSDADGELQGSIVLQPNGELQLEQ